MTGVIERTPYVSLLLVDRGEFIIIWVGLKMALQYRRWTGETQEKEEVLKARQRFMNALNGNALSILHSLVSFLVIQWLNEGKWDRLAYAILVPIVLCLVSMVLLESPKNKAMLEHNKDRSKK